ncbi:ChaN family lipoprotein [Ottowia sp. GY511]|uniref:ChaN family lipoprotein n=1 Tax=Ottowia flava TaxID=2675430 RepID=A0ABW4L1P5_9BURK|nr:ChaN family lipoprotein [Ottowia sp. GY511]TXK27269.1 ChaN family lipoprotein [Ottowia sp. GY511]
MRHRPAPLRTAAYGLLCATLTACATLPAPPLTPPESERLGSLLPADALLIGEQHDAPAHQQLERQVVQWLADRGALAAVAMEMAERGHSTADLPRAASATQVRRALAWDDAGWPWKRYGPVVMTAVRAGVPVLGANLPRSGLRAAMQNATLDQLLAPPMLAEQERRIREGHCNLLPDRQIRPMARVQIARDQAMAETVSAARQPGRTVLLVAGNGHVQRGLGVPVHLSKETRSKVLSAQSESAQAATENRALSNTAQPAEAADLRWPTPPAPPRDHCAELRQVMPAAR